MGRHNTLPFSLIRSTVTASVRRPKGRPEPARPPPLNPPLKMIRFFTHLQYDFIIVRNLLGLYSDSIYAESRFKPVRWFDCLPQFVTRLGMDAAGGVGEIWGWVVTIDRSATVAGVWSDTWAPLSIAVTVTGVTLLCSCSNNIDVDLRRFPQTWAKCVCARSLRN